MICSLLKLPEEIQNALRLGGKWSPDEKVYAGFYRLSEDLDFVIPIHATFQ
jgi:hypothetical protein